MSLLTALFNGGSGMRANQKWADITGRNISNVNTEGYARKDVKFSANADKLGGGVYVSEVVREMNSSLDRMFRLENSRMHYQQAIYEGIESYTNFIGQPNDEKSVSFKLSDFKAQLVSLVNNPSSAAIHQGVVMSAETLTKTLRDATVSLTELTNENTLQIKYEVAEVNENLKRLAELNGLITRRTGINHNANEIMDEMQQLVDNTSTKMDIKATFNKEGQVSMTTGNGTELLNSKTYQKITWNQASGRMYAGDMDITPADPNHRGFQHGTIAGLMEIRTKTIPEFNRQLDNLAASLIQQFEAADSSIAPGEAGLFTDDGNAFDPANIDGLASRIKVNDAVVPERGGSVWRIRDGVGATVQGPASDTTQIKAFVDTFGRPNPTDEAGTSITSGLTMEQFANNMIAYQQNIRAAAEIEYGNIQVSTQAIEASRLSATGVNLDDELQKLLVIEQSYAANAQVVNTVTQMLDILMTLGK